MTKYKVKDSSGHTHTITAGDIEENHGLFSFYENGYQPHVSRRPIAIFFRPVSVIVEGPNIVTDL